MQFAGHRPQFAHVAQHQPLAPRSSANRVQRRRQRGWIGVVGVVNHRAAVLAAQPLQPTANVAQGLQAPPDIVQGRASRQRASCRRQCIADVVPAGQWQANLRLSGGDDQAETIGGRIQNPGADRRRSIQTEIDDPSAWIQPDPIVGMGIVAVDDSHPGRAQSLENLALGARHAGHVAEPFQMTGTGIVDDRHVRPRQSG